MKARKIVAVILAVLLLVSCMPVYGENAVEVVATVQATSAPVQITPAPSMNPIEEATEQPVMPMSVMAEDEVTPAPLMTVAVTEVPATEVPATEAPATEVPATEVPATEAPATEVPATEAPATEVPATEAPATQVPATEAPATQVPATEAPATEAPVYVPVYAKIPADTELFADKELTEELGNLTGSEILIVIEESAEQWLYMALFDTKETVNSDSVEIAWFTANPAEIEWIAEEDLAAAAERMIVYRKANGNLVPYISFEYPEIEAEPTEAPVEEEEIEIELIIEVLVPVEEPEATEPVEEPAPIEEAEPADAPVDEPIIDDGLIADNLVAVEPETVPEVDENGMIVEELAPVEETVPEEVPAEEIVAEEIPAEEPVTEEIPAEGTDTEELPSVVDEELPSVEDTLIDSTEASETVVETDAEEIVVPELSVVATMYASSETVALGDTITVKAELIGYEGLVYTCEWECAVMDETGAVVGEWQPTGITALEHSFVLDETNAHVAWRLRTVVEA